MDVNVYDIGDTARCSCEFSLADEPADPTSVEISVKSPGGTVTTNSYAAGEISKSGTGVYYCDVQLTEAGLWFYRWVGTGAVATAEEGALRVRRQMVV